MTYLESLPDDIIVFDFSQQVGVFKVINGCSSNGNCVSNQRVCDAYSEK